MPLDNIFNFLLYDRPEYANPEMREILEDVSKLFDSCQRLRSAPVDFRVSLGAENAQLKERILMDIAYIGSMPKLHIVNEADRL